MASILTLFQVTLWSQMGLRWEGLLPALVMPLILTFILFLGPLVQSHLSVPMTTTLRMYIGMFEAEYDLLCYAYGLLIIH